MFPIIGDVVIRSNSGTVSVEAPLDQVKHYGLATEVKITSVSQTSYYEYGKTTFVDIKNGRLVITNDKESEVGTIYLSATSDAYNDITLATMSGAELPAVVQREAVTITSEKKLVATVQQVSDTGVEDTSKTEHIYLYAASTAYENTKGYSNVSDLGELVLEAPATGTVTLENGTQVDVSTLPDEVKEVKTSTATEAKTDAELRTIEANVSVTGATGDYTFYNGTYSLVQFRDNVNAGYNYAGCTVTLQSDADLKNIEWEPIGTETNSFSGIFDGQNHTIYNLKIISSSSSAYQGLFGFVNGVTAGATYKTTATDVYDTDNYVLKIGTYSEDQYMTAVKNLIVSDFDVTVGKESGVIVGKAKNAYIGNITTKHGSLTGTKNIGGVVGCSGRNMYFNNLQTSSDVTITSSAYSAAGIVGSVARNGDSTNTHFVLVKDCVNRAKITWNTVSENSNGSPIAGIVGNAGSCDGLQTVIYNCTNEGEISTGEDVKCGYASGIVGQTGNKTYVAYCTNSGNITAYASHVQINDNTPDGGNSGVAGICMTESIPVVACSNTGTLINTYDSQKVYDISSSTCQLTIVNETFDTVNALNTRLANSVGTAKAVVLKNITVRNTAGILVLPDGCAVTSITSNTKVCDSVQLGGNLISINMIGLNQTVTGTKTLSFSGSNNSITVAAGSTVGCIRLGGSNNALTNNGTMSNVSIFGNGTGLVVENKGTMNHLYMIGTSAEVTLNNHGTISSNDGGHTIWLECSGTLTLNNYGTIENQKNGIALLFYDGCTVTVKAYSGSTVTGSLGAYRGTHTIKIYYEEGATFKGYSWEIAANQTDGVYVYAMN